MLSLPGDGRQQKRGSRLPSPKCKADMKMVPPCSRRDSATRVLVALITVLGLTRDSSIGVMRDDAPRGCRAQELMLFMRNSYIPCLPVAAVQLSDLTPSEFASPHLC